MILELLFDFGYWVFGFITDAMPAAAPVVYNVVTTFHDFIGVGVWVIGNGMWTAILTSVAGWLTFRMVTGSVLFIYRLIPLCG